MSQFIFINASQGPFNYGHEFLVMPAEEPHTYASLERLAGEWVRLEFEHGHDLTTLPVFRLEPVLPEEVRPFLEKARQEFQAEMEEW